MGVRCRNEWAECGHDVDFSSTITGSGFALHITQHTVLPLAEARRRRDARAAEVYAGRRLAYRGRRRQFHYFRATPLRSIGLAMTCLRVIGGHATA